VWFLTWLRIYQLLDLDPIAGRELYHPKWQKWKTDYDLCMGVLFKTNRRELGNKTTV
jgi:hypothetical protein